MATTPPTDDVGLPPPQDDLDHVGMATLQADGTLLLNLRAVSADGTIGEAMMVVAPSDDRYDDMRQHIGPIKVGQSVSIPPFPLPEDTA